MFARKQTHPTPWSTDQKDKYSKIKETHFTLLSPNMLRYIMLLFSFIIAWFLLLHFWFPSTTATNSDNQTVTNEPSLPTCNGSVSVYMYELPPEFNTGLLADCRHLNVYTDMCPHMANRGLGQPISDMEYWPSKSKAWFSTHQFIGEMIFHARMEKHPCRTWDPSTADIFYVPFYGGLHVSSKFRERNITARDELAVRLVDYLQAQPWWRNHNGKDHFLALGRTSWDFTRLSLGGPDFGANSLLDLPAVKNMSVLTVEKHPWKGSNQHGIPYPSYFHPSTSAEMLRWQSKMRNSQRPHLFSFIGAPRKGLEKAAIRDEIIRQCGKTTRCKLVNCKGEGASKCYSPRQVLRVMSESEFCLQAPGDSFTRRSTFDSILSGCIPVFFSPHTAYTQYKWFLPEEREKYSVFIDEKKDESRGIEEKLMKIPRDEVGKMRERVIDLIPKLTYMHPNWTEFGFKDAVDVALAELSKHVRSLLDA